MLHSVIDSVSSLGCVKYFHHWSKLQIVLWNWGPSLILVQRSTITNRLIWYVQYTNTMMVIVICTLTPLQFNGLLDIVYLAVVFSAQTETAEPMDDESILMGASKAWARLSSLLTRLFQLLLTRTPHLNPLEHIISAREKAVPSNGLQDSVLSVIIKRLATTIREVLGMVSKEELSLIIEKLSQMVNLTL